MGYMWIQAAWGHSPMWTTVNASRVHISSSRPNSDFSYNSDTQLLVTSDSTSAPLLVISSKHHTSFSCFQESPPQITCTQVYPLALPPGESWLEQAFLFHLHTSWAPLLLLLLLLFSLPPSWSCCQECPPPLLPLPTFPSPKASHRRPAVLLSLKGLCPGYQTATN